MFLAAAAMPLGEIITNKVQKSTFFHTLLIGYAPAHSDYGGRDSPFLLLDDL